MRCVLGWTVHRPRLPARVLVRLTVGLHFPHRQLFIHAPGVMGYRMVHDAARRRLLLCLGRRKAAWARSKRIPRSYHSKAIREFDQATTPVATGQHAATLAFPIPSAPAIDV